MEKDHIPCLYLGLPADSQRFKSFFAQTEGFFLRQRYDFMPVTGSAHKPVINI